MGDVNNAKTAAEAHCGSTHPIDGYDAFLAGADWQRERDIGLIKNAEEMGLVHGGVSTLIDAVKGTR